MALGPISNAHQPIQPAPARDVTEARRAFFQAALGKVEASEPTVPAVAPKPVDTPKAAAEPAPSARYRPGSLIDIKV